MKQVLHIHEEETLIVQWWRGQGVGIVVVFQLPVEPLHPPPPHDEITGMRCSEKTPQIKQVFVSQCESLHIKWHFVLKWDFGVFQKRTLTLLRQPRVSVVFWQWLSESLCLARSVLIELGRGKGGVQRGGVSYQELHCMRLRDLQLCLDLFSFFWLPAQAPAVFCFF